MNSLKRIFIKQASLVLLVQALALSGCSGILESKLKAGDDRRVATSYWSKMQSFVQDYCLKACSFLLRSRQVPALISESAGSVDVERVSNVTEIAMVKGPKGEMFVPDNEGVLLGRNFLKDGQLHSPVDFFLSSFLSTSSSSDISDDDFRSVIDSSDDEFFDFEPDDSDGRESEKTTTNGDDSKIVSPTDGSDDGKTGHSVTTFQPDSDWQHVKTTAQRKNLSVIPLLDEPLLVVNFNSLVGKGNASLGHGDEFLINEKPYVLSFTSNARSSGQSTYNLSFYPKDSVTVKIQGNVKLVHVIDHSQLHFTISNVDLKDRQGFHVSKGPPGSRYRFYYSFYNSDIIRATFDNGISTTNAEPSLEIMREIREQSKIFRNFVTLDACVSPRRSQGGRELIFL